MLSKIFFANIILVGLAFSEAYAVKTKEKIQFSKAAESSFFSYGRNYEAGIVLSKRNLNSVPAYFLVKTTKGRVVESKVIDIGSYSYLNKELLRIENYLIRKKAFANVSCGSVVSTSVKDGILNNFCLDLVDNESRSKIDAWQNRALVHFL